MYIHRGLVLVFLVIFIFSPSIQEWISNNSAEWYRPYIAWLMVIGFSYFSQFRFFRKTTSH